uniref:Putative secreted protein n=1 Tax=Anopheles darlingi TaxID=43151 RepID=A0A2M4D1H0_ANODA
MRPLAFVAFVAFVACVSYPIFPAHDQQHYVASRPISRGQRCAVLCCVLSRTPPAKEFREKSEIKLVPSVLEAPVSSFFSRGSTIREPEVTSRGSGCCLLLLETSLKVARNQHFTN